MSELDDIPKSLKYQSDDCEGFTRRKHGRGFVYLDCDGNKIEDDEIIKRIKKLVIPPNWKDVWICQQENGHLQVTGYDVKNRKQYIYHPKWVEFRQESKYNKLPQFGRKLPIIRNQIEKDIRKRNWPKEKILALTVMMLDEYYIRIGNKQYEKQNQTYGFTTLRRKHIDENDGKLILSYKAKSGKERKVKIESKKLVKLIKQISELPGYEIFKYLENNQSQRLYSHDVNDYLEEITGEYFTAKDFRTWGGTVLAIDQYKEAFEEIEEHPNRKLETTIIKKVAKVLSNTVAVCREYYIFPKVLEILTQGKLEEFKSKKIKRITHSSQLSENEKLVLKIIETE